MREFFSHEIVQFLKLWVKWSIHFKFVLVVSLCSLESKSTVSTLLIPTVPKILYINLTLIKMFSIREKVSVYFPVRSSDDDPTSESKDHLLPEDDFPRRKPRHWLSRVVLVSITLLYTLTVVSITITIVRRERLQGTRFTCRSSPTF